MPFLTPVKDVMLASLPATLWASLHSTDTPPTRAAPAEVTDPPYARQMITIGVSINGVRTAIGTAPLAVFDVPGGTDIMYVGYWDAQSGGNFLAYSSIGDLAYGAPGKAQLNRASFSITDVVGG